MNLEELKESYDWREAVSYAPFEITDVAEIIATDEGENDGATWVGVFRLNNGEFAFVEAGCDYTGWDCQASGEGATHADLEHLKRWSMNSSARRRLKMELPDLDTIP